MPKFLLPVFILALVSLSGFGCVVLRMGPDQTVSVTLFLVTFFLSLTLALSLVFFFVHRKFFFKPRTFDAFGPLVTDDELRPLFRTSLRRSFLVALLVTLLLVLRRFL